MSLSCLLLGFIMDEALCIVDGLGQGPVLVAKLCEVQTGRGKEAAHSKWCGFGLSPAHPRGCWPWCAPEGPRGAESPQGYHHPRSSAGGDSQRQPWQ